MIKTFAIKKGQKPTAEMIKEVEEAKRHPITFDEDCPELSPAMIKAFKITSGNSRLFNCRDESGTLE